MLTDLFLRFRTNKMLGLQSSPKGVEDQGCTSRKRDFGSELPGALAPDQLRTQI
jgi:hypothetical protein